MKRILLLFGFAIVLSVSCRQGTKKSSYQVAKASFKQFEIVESWRTDTVLMTPESVIYDKVRNVIYVSDMNNEPRMKDNNGFISKLSTDGKILDLHWVDGLSSPKGLAIVGDTLYAADVDEVVAIDIIKGYIIKKMTYPGMKMLNDITSAPDGSIYISDTDGNILYRYINGKISPWLTEGLNGPNGLLVDGSRLLLASQGSNDFTTIDFNTKTRKVVTEGINHGDGIAFTGIPGYYLVSDWGGEIYIINPDYSKFTILNTKAQMSNSADIDYIPELNLLLVPTFYKNCVVAYKLSEK
jgi:DNA-binding beta-propeller fold protein YncE